ncbi:MAG: DMT family transporter [Bdellovibrio sp.]
MNLLHTKKEKGFISSEVTVYVAAIVSVLLWSVAPIFMKIGLKHMDFSSLLLTRFTVSSLIFLPYIRQILKGVNRLAFPKWIFFLSITGFIYYLQTSALKSFPVSWYLVIFSLNPLLTLIIMKTKINRKFLLAILTAIAGTMMFVNDNELGMSIPIEGWVYMLGGMVAWAAYTSFLPQLQRVYSDVEVTALTSFVGLGSAVLSLVVKGFDNLDWHTVGLISSGILGIIFPLAYYLFSLAIRHKPAFGIISQYLEPVFGVVIAYFFLGESLGTFQIFGGALIVFSMGYLTKLT